MSNIEKEYVKQYIELQETKDIEELKEKSIALNAKIDIINHLNSNKK